MRHSASMSQIANMRKINVYWTVNLTSQTALCKMRLETMGIFQKQQVNTVAPIARNHHYKENV